MKSTKSLPREVLHEELLGMMRTQALEDVRDHLRRVIGAELGGEPIVTRALIEGCVVIQRDPNGNGVEIRSNVISKANAKPNRRRTPASLKRQAAKMRAYWRKRKAGTK